MKRNTVKQKSNSSTGTGSDIHTRLGTKPNQEILFLVSFSLRLTLLKGSLATRKKKKKKSTCNKMLLRILSVTGWYKMGPPHSSPSPIGGCKTIDAYTLY